MKTFDCIVMNPPYQGSGVSSQNDYEGGGKGTRNNSLWDKFVTKAFDIVKPDGFVAMIHPPRWRKPDDDTGALLKSKDMKYLEMHGKSDGMKTFGCMTRYDWYICKNSNPSGETVVVDENGDETKIYIPDIGFIPHSNFDALKKVVAKQGEERCKVVCDSSYHTQREELMAKEKTAKYKYPCVHSTTKDKIGYWYSCTNKKGHFGIPKVIFGDNGGDTGIFNAVVDEAGKTGLTQHAIGIAIDSKAEGEKVKMALEAEAFTKLVRSCNWGGFQIDWRMFKYFKKDWWKEFV